MRRGPFSGGKGLIGVSHLKKGQPCKILPLFKSLCKEKDEGVRFKTLQKGERKEQLRTRQSPDRPSLMEKNVMKVKGGKEEI